MINYDKQFNAYISKVVRQFNSKVKRLQSQGYRYLPKTESVADLKATYFERDTLKRKLRQLESFNTRGAEEVVELMGGAKITKWEYNTLRADRRRFNKIYAKGAERYGSIVPTIRGVRQDESYARMGDARYENFKVMRDSMSKDLNTMTQSELNRAKRSMLGHIRRHEKQKYVFWSNYITFIEDVAYKADVPPEVVESIKEKISKMDIDDFIDFYNTEKAFSQILNDYIILKMKAEGFADSEKAVVQDNYKAINELLDVYL